MTKQGDKMKIENINRVKVNVGFPIEIVAVRIGRARNIIQ